MQMRAGVAKKTIRSIRQQAFEATHLFDSHPESSLDFEKVRAAVKDGYDRPFLLIDSTIVRAKTRRFTAAMPRVLPHYAVKANPDPRILRLMLEQGAGFEIASIAELDLLLALGVAAADVFYSNPVKSRDQIAHAASRGVLWYVIDSVEELKKIQSIKADARLYLRIDTPNIGSDWPLAGKFGAHPSEVRDIVVTAARLKVDLAGVAFHVGSQCRNPENWRVGIEKSRGVFDQMQKAGLNPRLLNIGGGFPVRHVKPIPAIEVIGEVVNRALAAFPDRAGPVPGLRCRLFRLPHHGDGDPREQALDASGRGAFRWHHRDGRRAQVQDPHRPLRTGHSLERRGTDLRFDRRGDARRAAPFRFAGGRLYLPQERRRLHHGLRERL